MAVSRQPSALGTRYSKLLSLFFQLSKRKKEPLGVLPAPRAIPEMIHELRELLLDVLTPQGGVAVAVKLFKCCVARSR